jgi:hypothetical protein
VLVWARCCNCADIQRAEAHWTITISRGRPGEEQETTYGAIHPQLIKHGFADFAQESKDSYLFLTATQKEEVRGRLNGVKNRLSEFVRSIVNDERIRPNHAWRHRLISLCRLHAVDQELRRMITGHAGKGVDEVDCGEPEGLYSGAS